METGEKKEERISKSALIAMIAIVVGLIVVAVYANWQNAHRDRIETTTITRITPEASASPSSTP
jgi:ABC-type lipoprotein release transport system permease subunit